MKKIVLLFLLTITTVTIAQSDYRDLPGRWRLGFNMGGIWESSDVKPIPGLGGGFTIEKILNKRANALLGFSLGFRYLGGRTYGLAATPTYDLSKNEALNGTYNPAIRYDTMPGYFYANHKTFIQEGSLELKMNFPRLEKNTGIIFHLWGGIGIGKYKTWIDALDKDGKMYDFSHLQGQHVTQSDLSRIYDGQYETLAMGSGTNGTLCILPSLGAGIGYHLSKHVSFVLEHKISFPGTNLLDGIEYPKNCPVTGSKDFYNYTSIGLVFTFYGQHHSTANANTSSTNNNNVYTNPVGTQTGVNNNNTVYTAPVVYPPTVMITYPSDNFNSAYDYTTVNATVHNVSSAQQISISQNGYAINHFSYNASNGALNFQTFLAQGVNNFVISASNSGGTASQGVTINYNPTPTFTTNGYSTTMGNSTVTTNTVITTNTTTVNPVSTATIAPSYTTTATHTVTPTFTTSTTHTVVTETASGTLTTTTTNTAAATATVSPTFTASGSGVHLKPVVTFIDPNVYPAETTNSTYNVIGSVQNVSGAGQISVSINGNNVPDFVYNPASKQVTFPAAIQLGYNTITITGTNSYGSDTKSMVINHKQSGRPPKVQITNPSTSPFTSLQSNVIVSGYVYNVVSSSGINVTANGAPTPFNYNINTHEISIALNLAVGNTAVNISATNPYGSDAGSITLIYKKMTGAAADSVAPQITTAQTHTYTNTPHNPPGGPHNPPAINVLSPNFDPFNTNTGNISVSATIDYIVNPASVSVSYNGVQLSVMFDMGSKHLNFSSPLKPGQNTFVISASNNDGTVTKSVNVNYAPIIVNTNPTNSVNQSEGPTYGHGGWNLGTIFNNSGGGKTESGPINPSPGPKQGGIEQPGGGMINPGRPMKTSTPVSEPPKSSINENKPAETGGSQIRTRPR